MIGIIKPALGIIHVFLSSFTVFASAIKVEEADRWLGLQHPPLPQNLESSGGWVVGGNSLAITNISHDGKRYLFLDKLLGRDTQGKAFFKVIDVLALPPIDLQVEGVFGYSCRLNGKPNPNLIAIAKLEDENTEFLTEVRKAWVVDTSKEKFGEIPVRGQKIECENMSYGL